MVNNFLNTLSTEETNATKFVLNEMFSFYLKNPSGKFEIYSLLKNEGCDSSRIIEILNDRQLIRESNKCIVANQYDKKHYARITWEGIAYVNQEFIDNLMEKFDERKDAEYAVDIAKLLNVGTNQLEIVKDFKEYLILKGKNRFYF